MTFVRENLKALVWGISIALSWTWGLGLFFSVQMAIQFGFPGLLGFAIPNAIGLMLFGGLTQRIAMRQGSAKAFEDHFLKTSHSMRYVILAYQLTAISLTFFAIFSYLFDMIALNMALGVLIVLGAALVLGEQFGIGKIKWSHFIMFIVILLCMLGVFLGFYSFLNSEGLSWKIADGKTSAVSFQYLGFWIPILAGFLVGPWLDVQQWHRAIQIHRETTSIRRSYIFGGLIFLGILLFHGTVALSVYAVGGDEIILPSKDGIFHAKNAIVNFFFVENASIIGSMLKVSYVGFIFLCIISTLDSGYVSLKWYMKKLVSKSEHIILSIIPEDVMASPVIPMILAVLVALAAVPLNFELEYFMCFYGSFSLCYSIVFIFRTAYRPEFTNFTQVTLFAVSAFSLGLFGVGYFEQYWYLMALGALLPIIYGFVTISGRVVVDDIQRALPRPDSTDDIPTTSVSGMAADRAITALQTAISRLDPKTGDRFKTAIQKIEPTAAEALANIISAINPVEGDGNIAAPPISDEDAAFKHARGHAEGKWYVHSFMMTYSDTNSVGNVYFGNYVLFVGKVREMFFEHCMPDFDLNDTPFYILTRQIEHKFQMEAREFDIITVRIRVAGFNRKFVTLEHEIVNQSKEILGKGKQILMFVDSKDYHLVDLPNEVRVAFLPFC